MSGAIMGVGVCLRDPAATALAEDFLRQGIAATPLAPVDLTDTGHVAALRILVIDADPVILTPAVLMICDRAGVRIVPFVRDEQSARFATSLGLPSASEPTAAAVRAAAESAPREVRPRTPAQVITVWGPHGAPGRTSMAIALAYELARGARDVCLIDADSHAPAVAPTLGLSDDVPGLAGACRQIARGALTEAEYRRIRTDIAPGVDAPSLLAGINRPSRWPELRGDLVAGVLSQVRSWSDHVVVDTAASLEQDEHLVSDMAEDGPKRNAATLAALGAADHVVAVASADPVGMTRFVRAVHDLRSLAPGARVSVVANRVRSRAVGFDAKSQIRSTLSRLGGIDEVWFVPDDPAAHDRATLHAVAVAEVAPRSAYVAAVRRLAAALVQDTRSRS